MPLIKIKKLSIEATIPSFATQGDAGMDLFSIDNISIEPGKTLLVKTGLALEIPYGYEGQIRSKSGIAIKNEVHVLNSPGTIDSGYRGEVAVILHNSSLDKTYIAPAKSKIAQLVIKPIETDITLLEVDLLTDTQRGTGGFGSTGL